MLRDNELKNDIKLDKYSNFSIGIELAPSQADLWLRFNETLYEHYVETINNYTEVRAYGYETNGYKNMTF